MTSLLGPLGSDYWMIIESTILNSGSILLLTHIEEKETSLAVAEGVLSAWRCGRARGSNSELRRAVADATPPFVVRSMRDCIHRSMLIERDCGSAVCYL
jgi:hypothetical protein